MDNLGRPAWPGVTCLSFRSTGPGQARGQAGGRPGAGRGLGEGLREGGGSAAADLDRTGKQRFDMRQLFSRAEEGKEAGRGSQ